MGNIEIQEMPVLLGNKEKFAIEFGKDEKFKLDKFCIYLGNEKLGYYNDAVYLSYLKSAIDCLLQQNLIIPEFESLSNVEIFDVIFYNNEVDYYKCVFSLGENFDDFLICTYRSGKNIVFLWKFVEKPFFTYKHFDQKLHMAEVNIDFLIQICYQFLQFYNLNEVRSS